MVQSARAESPADPARVVALVDEGLALDASNAELLRVRTEVGGAAPPPSAPPSAATPEPTTTTVASAAEPVRGAPTGPGREPERGRERDRGRRGGRGPQPQTFAPQPLTGTRETAPPVRETAPVRETTPPPRETVATNSKVLQLFKSGRFRDAADAATTLAESSSGAAADQARSLARDIDRFSQAWSAAQTSGDLPTKIRNLESALRLDRAVTGGHYASQIQPLLVRAHADHASAAWRAGRFASACQSVEAALRLDARNDTATSMARDCAAKARQFYEEGFALRSSDPDRAHELWRQVIQMVPRDNEWYSRAYERLNNTQGPTRDEDE
jgi:hypothetical protein